MKKSIILLCVLLCFCLCFAACVKKPSPEPSVSLSAAPEIESTPPLQRSLHVSDDTPYALSSGHDDDFRIYHEGVDKKR